MKIYETAVRKPISTIVIFLGVIVFGLFSVRNLAVDMYPEMDVPYLSVVTTYSGANAADIETNITRPLEDQLNSVSNLKKLTSTSSDNISMIVLQMDWGSDLTEAANDIRDILSRTSMMLPDEADDPILFKLSSSMIPVMVMSATADESYNGLTKILDDKMVNVLNRIDGVGSINVYGGPNRIVRVDVDPVKLDAYKLTVEQIAQLIQAENINVPSGSIDIGNNTFNVKADGEFKTSDDIQRIVVANVMGRTIMLKDVAAIKDTLEKATMDERVDGKRGVRIMVQKQSGANSVSIVNAINAQMPAILESLPDDVTISTIMDSSDSIKGSINSLSETVMFAFLFVILVVLFFLGRWRATFIICLTIPVSLIVAFIYLYMTGSTLNVISLSSLSIAIGMVVDDAIVVLENITKHLERGSTPKEAAIYATNEVWLAVIATTLVIVAVFLPLTMVGGMAGILFKELGWIVTLVVCVSTIAAITLTPMLSSLLLKTEGGQHTYKGIGIIFKPIDKFLDKLDNGYAKLLTWAVRHRAVVLLSTFAIFLASLFLLRLVPTEFFPASDTSYIEAEVDLQQNLNVDYTVQTARKIDSVFKANYPEIEQLSTSAGAPSGDNASLFTMGTASYKISYRIKLNKPNQRDRSMFVIADLMRSDLEQFPEVREFTVTPGGSNGGGGIGGVSTIALKVFGQDLNETDRVANDLKDKISELSGTRDVQLSRDDIRPEYNVVFDPDKLALYGLNRATASNYVRNRINGLTASKFREDGEEYDIIVRYDEANRTSFEDIMNITLYGSNGQAVKVRDVATLEEEFAPPAIERENRQRIVTVNVALAEGMPLGVVTEEIRTQVLNDYPVPDGVILEMGGSVEDQADSFGDIGTILILVVFLVYVVMATQFESLKMPFIIMFTLPTAFTGVFLALWITGTPLSLVALIGAVMLVGIVTKNGIVMVDYTNLLRERGSAINHAVIESGKSRLRPVLMTSLTTILGMLPLAIGTGEGSEIWQPMGIAIIGGLTFSTFLTLLVIPCVYSAFGAAGLKKEKKEIKEKRKQEKRARKRYEEARALK